MSALHPLGELQGSAHLAARVAMVGASALAAVLDRLQLAWRELEPTTWWASNGRDVLLLFSVALQAVALLQLGFPLPAAVVAAAQLTLASVLVELVLLRRGWMRAHDAVAVGLSVGVALPLAIWPERCFGLLDALARAASPG
jgi:hypothetical protein